MTLTPSVLRFLVELPARIVDAAQAAYWLVLTALTLVALTTTALWVIVALAGYPLP